MQQGQQNGKKDLWLSFKILKIFYAVICAGAILFCKMLIIFRVLRLREELHRPCDPVLRHGQIRFVCKQQMLSWLTGEKPGKGKGDCEGDG